LADLTKVGDKSIGYVAVNPRKPNDYYDKFSQLFWMCLSCEKKLVVNQVECPDCKIIRPLETYQNILYSPELAWPCELNALNDRRKFERKLVANAMD
jgi:hypothetical protein